MVRLAKAINDDIYYKDFAEYLSISNNGFYNWLNGYYELREDKIERLLEVVVDLSMD